jgi:putative phage-type endonuclease
MAKAYVKICKAGDACWLDERQKGIGASEIAAVLGESPWCSALALYLEKTTGERRDISDVERIQWGHILEPIVLREYARRTGRRSRSLGHLLRSSAYPWALATLDGDTSDGSASPWPLEIKTAAGYKADDWLEGPPRPYELQLQHQMLVTGAPKATIVCLLGGQQLVWCDVERNEREIRRIIEAGSAFWRAVEAKEPPAPDGSESAGRALSKLYPSDDGSTVELGGDVASALDELEAAKAAEKAAHDRASRAQQAVQAAMGPATTAYAGRWLVTWKASERAGYTVAPSVVRTMRRKAREEERAA